MPIPPGSGLIQWLLTDTGNNHKYMTALGVGLEAATATVVIAAAEQAFETNLSPFVGNECEGDAVRLLVGTSNPSEPITWVGGAWEGGTASGETCPPNVALLIQKRTSEGGRRNRGRMFLPKPTESGVEETGLLSPTQFADFASSVESFQEDMEAIVGVTNLQLFHSSGDQSATTITSLSAQRLVATQRRRLRR